MPQERWSLRRGSVDLTSKQWSIVGVALVVALIGLALELIGHILGASLMALAGTTIGFVGITARAGT